MASQNRSELFNWIVIAGQADSLPIETSEEWKDWVTRPIIESPLAPRQARATLEIIGFFAAHGVQIYKLLNDILNIPKYRHLFTDEKNS
jgi:hypothetical protein